MTRQTSISAYNAIKENGLLSKRRWEVYDILFRFGPLTANEAFKKIATETGKSSSSFLSVSNARFTELRRNGLLVEAGERSCSITGVRVIEWDVTDKLPVKFEKPKKTKCKHCNGTGTIIEQQARFDI